MLAILLSARLRRGRRRKVPARKRAAGIPARMAFPKVGKRDLKESSGTSFWTKVMRKRTRMMAASDPARARP